MTEAQPRPLVQALWGLIWLLGGLWFWHWAVGNPVHELALIRNAKTIDAELVDTSEFDGEDERGNYYEGVNGAYLFRVDGKEFYALSTQSHSRFDAIALVEYLDDDPAVNRMKGDGAQSVSEWLWRKLGLGLVLAGFCLAPGIAQLRSAYIAHRRQRGTAV